MRLVAATGVLFAAVLAGFGLVVGPQAAAKPAAVPDGHANSIVRVAAGAYTGYAVLPDGRVRAWGDDLEGQIGDSGPWSSRTEPVEVRGLPAAVLVAGGGNSSYALLRDGRVWAWGDDSQAELADRRFTARQTPRPVPTLTTVKGIAAGAFTAYAIVAGGKAWSWGDNSFGQLGTGSSAVVSTAPREIVGLSDVVAIRAGTSDAYALLSDGTVWVWGDNSLGQLGGAGCGSTGSRRHGGCRDSGVPHQVPGLVGIAAIAAGGDSGYALGRDGTVWAWGDDEFGELGDGVRTFDQGVPVRVKGLDHVVAIAAGSCSAYALLRNGTVWAWGRGDLGQLGDGSAASRSLPVRVRGVTGVRQVVGGGDMAFALEWNGSLWSWGANSLGQLGNGSEAIQDAPVRVLGLPGSPHSGKP